MKVLTLLLSILITFRSPSTYAQEKQIEKIRSGIQVLKDLGSMKENIPHELLQMSEGIIIVPRMINAGFVLSGKRGKGIALIKKKDGTWSDPVFITITGGGIGFQAGIQSVDLVLIFRHQSTLEEIGNGTFTLGGDVSATAGPVGRSASANTDFNFEAEVYSYSKSKGLFAGISLNGSAIEVDEKSNTVFYGEPMTLSNIFKDESINNQEIKDLKQELSSLYEKE